MRLLVTGGLGFIGSNFIRFWLTRHPADVVINLDAQTYAGNPTNLADLTGNPFYHYIHGDIADPAKVAEAMDLNPDAVINFAAESHVDRSIQAAAPFIRTNVAGVQVLLEAVRRHKTRLFVQISTDEVYGSVASGKSKVTDPLLPSSPYSAAKAAADLLVQAYIRTYRIPAIITRCTNNYGPYQHPEKFLPLLITRSLTRGLLPVYGDGLQVRDWLYVLDHCHALELVIQRGEPGKIYHIGAEDPQPNIEVARAILDYFRLPTAYLVHVPDRPGHDRRYCLDTAATRSELGWKPTVGFAEGLRQTIRWYQENEAWWRPLIQ
ncbi:MAG TPA: dTDP-glucose 4,6-dehydratase [Bacillota bacterium]|nr:dTDP-glucose 4,6-dehydratase [Bacillota bacterium]